MSENKTIPTDKSVQAFLDTVEDDQKREDSWALVQLMQEVTGLPPQMWGSAIIGFGKVHYKYASGREGDMILVGSHRANKTSPCTAYLGPTNMKHC